MSERRIYLDAGYGEMRGVVTLDGRPERLLVERDDDVVSARAGAHLVARVRKLDRASALAFLDLGDGEGVLNLGPETHGLTEGGAIEIEIRSEARRGKLAVARFVAAAEGAPRSLAPPPTQEQRLAAFAPGATLMTGAVARSMADGAQDELFETVHALPGGGTLSIEPTRALIAIDVDLGDRPGADAKRASRAANFAAIAAAARLLRLKGLGGLVVIDLVGRGHDAPALLSAARNAFAPDNPGVALAAVSRFGTIELTVPRRARPALEILADEAGEPSALTRAFGVIRALEREAASDGGGRFEALVSVDVAAAAGPALARLIERVGSRVSLTPDSGRARSASVVRRM